MISAFTSSDYSIPVRTETSRFILAMCSGNSQSLHMFIACRSFPLMVLLLEPDNYEDHKDMIHCCLDSILKVFKLQVRIFLECSEWKLAENSRNIQWILICPFCQIKIHWIFLEFSRSIRRFVPDKRFFTFSCEFSMKFTWRRRTLRSTPSATSSLKLVYWWSLLIPLVLWTKSHWNLMCRVFSWNWAKFSSCFRTRSQH